MSKTAGSRFSPDEVRDMADSVREKGFEEIAAWLEDNADGLEQEGEADG